MYEPNPNQATLWENKFKTTDAHPTKKGQLLITRSLLLELSEQQGKGGDFLVDISAWEKVTKSGKEIINIRIEKPYKFEGSAPAPSDRIESATEPEPRQPPAPTNLPPLTAEQKARAYLSKLKHRIANITEYPDFEELYNKIKSAEVWEVFQGVPAIAQEAGEILSKKKTELVLGTTPIDLSDLLSKIDVECDRLRLPKKEHCLARWDKPRSALTEAELLIYLDELQSAQAIAKDDEFF